MEELFTLLSLVAFVGARHRVPSDSHILLVLHTARWIYSSESGTARGCLATEILKFRCRVCVFVCVQSVFVFGVHGTGNRFIWCDVSRSN